MSVPTEAEVREYLKTLSNWGRWGAEDELEELARTAARLGRWEFLLTVAPLRLKNVTGSPINPIAVF